MAAASNIRPIDLMIRRRRHLAFVHCFVDKDGKPTAAGAIALRHLARFCHANATSICTSSTGVDPIATGVLEGRRQVWMEINYWLNFDESVLQRLSEARTEDDA